VETHIPEYAEGCTRPLGRVRIETSAPWTFPFDEKLVALVHQNQNALQGAALERCSTGALMAMLGIALTENTPTAVAMEYMAFMTKIKQYEELPSSVEITLQELGGGLKDGI
jgi:hypothetical protein